MKTLTISTASEIKDAPTKSYLYRIVKQDNRPDYFYHDGDKWMVDIEHPSWLELLRKRAMEGVPGYHKAEKSYTKEDTIESVKPKPAHKNQNVQNKIKSMTPDTSGLDIADLRELKLEAEIKEKNIKNEILYLNMQKQSGNIIDFDLAKYLFFSYMEKANIDFYRAARKNEAIIANFVKEGKVREIIQVVENECTAILKEIQKKQKEALDKWNEEEGRK